MDLVAESFYRAAAQGVASDMVRVARARAAYEGDYAPALKPSAREREAAARAGVVPVDHSVAVGAARVVVDSIVSALVGTRLSLVTEDPQYQPALDAWTDSVGLHAQLVRLAQNGSISGHCFLELYAVNTDLYLRPLVIPSEEMRIKVDGEDAEQRLGYEREWVAPPRDGRAVRRRKTWARMQDGTWLITNEERVGTAPWVSLHDPVVWTLSVPPVLDCQHNPSASVYGTPDLTDDVLQLGDAINRVASNLSKVIHLYGHRPMVGYGVPRDAQIDIAPGAVTRLPPKGDAGAEIDTLDTTADVAGGLALLDTLRRELYAAAGVPEIVTGKLDQIGNLSGTALRVLYGPLIARTEARRLTYAPLIAEIGRAVLAAQGITTGVRVTWPEVVPTNLTEQAQAAIALQDAGVSVATSLALAVPGVDAETEAEQRALEGIASGQAAQDALDQGQIPGA